MKLTYRIFKQRKTWELILLIASTIFLVYLAVTMVIDTGFSWKFDHDYIDGYGSILGGIGACVSIYYIYWTLYEQRNQFLRQDFETKYFELVKYNRDILGSATLTAIEGHPVGVEAIKTFREQIEKAIRMITPIVNSLRQAGYYKEEQMENEARSLWGENYDNRTVINISMLCVFFGVKDNGAILLKEKYLLHYKDELANGVIKRLKLCIMDDPDQEPPTQKIEESRMLQDQNKYFFGFHQQFGNYFRTLFQCVKYVDGKSFLKYGDKYGFVKMLRCQMTNDEEIVFFYNSLSDLGLEWEMGHKDNANRCWVTKYNLIKNIPNGASLYSPQDFYPNIDYEWNAEAPADRQALLKRYK